MNRYTVSLASLALLAACQDSTGPGSETVQPGDHAPEGSPTFEPSGTEAASVVKHLWATVNQDGSLTWGSRVTAAKRLGVGRYEITFDRSVAGCAYIATPRIASSQALGVFTAGGHSSANGVYVETKNQGGGLTDGPFNLVVACGPLNTRFAVVGYSANLVRATSGTTITSLGAGRYNVRYSSSVGGCAFLATVADPSNGLVYSPAGVYTAKGPDSRTVYVETKNPGGGLQAGVPFHLAIICSGTATSRFAVVKAGGATQRASTGTTSSRPSTGNYLLAHNVSVVGCAAVATRGSVNTTAPYTPATVEVGPYQTTGSFWVQVRQLQFFGGALANQAFHAAVIC